jgi:hypothetical protein
MCLLLDNSIPWGRLLHDYIQKYSRVERPFRITRFGVATLAVFQELGRDLPLELRTMYGKLAKARASDVLQCATPLLRECDGFETCRSDRWIDCAALGNVGITSGSGTLQTVELSEKPATKLTAHSSCSHGP